MARQREELGVRATDRAWQTLAIACVLLGMGLRILGARGDPWLDEIWSWALAREPDGAIGVLALAHDNNHPLNTLWLRAVQSSNEAWVWRLPSLVFGTASLLVAVGLAWHRSKLEAALAAAVCSGSFLLVTYQSEARGYSGMLLAVLLAWWACRAHLERPGARWIALLAGASALGALSHPTFLQGWLALATWTGWRYLREGGGARAALRRWLALHAAPIVLVLALAAGFLSRLVVGGGPERPLAEILLETAALGLGAPLSLGWEIGAAAAALLVLAADVAIARRTGSDEWVATIGAVLVFPAVTLVVFQPEFVAPRYFLVPVVVWSLALARVAAHAWVRSGSARVLAMLLAAAVLVGNGSRIVPFVREGRGHYSEALRHVQERTVAPSATLASADDLDISLVLTFFRRALPSSPGITYLGQGRGRVADWYLVQSVEARPRIAPRVRDGLVEYDFEAHFPYFGQSGAHWILYRRAR